MHPKSTTLVLGFTAFITHIASAADDLGKGSSEPLANMLLAFMPIGIFLVILYFFFRRQMNSPEAKLQREYVERQIRHTQRTEELLERIAVALEKK